MGQYCIHGDYETERRFWCSLLKFLPSALYCYRCKKRAKKNTKKHINLLEC